MKNKKNLVAIVVFSVVTITGISFNINPAVYAIAGRDERVERVTERRCTTAQARLGVAKTRYENIKERRVAKYTELAERLDDTISRAEAENYDTSGLTSARSAVQNDIKTYQTQAQELYDALTKTEQAACEESEAPYIDTLGKARIELRDVREAALKVHQTFQDQVVPELKELATWAKDQQ